MKEGYKRGGFAQMESAFDFSQSWELSWTSDINHHGKASKDV